MDAHPKRATGYTRIFGLRIPGLAAGRLGRAGAGAAVPAGGGGRHAARSPTTRTIHAQRPGPDGARRVWGSSCSSAPRAGLRLDGIIMAPPAFASDVIKIGNETSFGGPDFQILGTLFFNFLRGAAAAPAGHRQEGDGDGAAAHPGRSRRGRHRRGRRPLPGPAGGHRRLRGRRRLPRQRQRPRRHPRRPGPLPAAARRPPTAIDDEDGCPEEDTDQDGFLGSRDKCPDAPETKNGFQDDDGCPDELPPAGEEVHRRHRGDQLQDRLGQHPAGLVHRPRPGGAGAAGVPQPEAGDSGSHRQPRPGRATTTTCRSGGRRRCGPTSSPGGSSRSG